MTIIPAAEIPTVEARRSVEEPVPAGRLPRRIWSVEMQMKNEVIKDFNVRLALSRAIDRATLVKVVYNDAYPAGDLLAGGGPTGFPGQRTVRGHHRLRPGGGQEGAGRRRLPRRSGLPHAEDHHPGQPRPQGRGGVPPEGLEGRSSGINIDDRGRRRQDPVQHLQLQELRAVPGRLAERLPRPGELRSSACSTRAAATTSTSAATPTSTPS